MKRLAIMAEVARTTAFVLFMVGVFVIGMPIVMIRDAVIGMRS